MEEERGNVLIRADLRVSAERLDVFDFILSGLRELMLKRKITTPDPFINPHLLLDVAVHSQADLKRFNGPDAFKIGGHLCFWIARLKPFRALPRNPLFTNEMCGLFVGLGIVAESKGVRHIPFKELSNLFYELRYGHASPIGVSNLLQLLYCDGALPR
jgi:hypothetical protein